MTLQTVLKRNPDVRRLFGRRELVIIEKQLWGVHLKPSERTRLSRDIRKKCDAIRALAPFIDDFRLKSGAEVKRIVADTVELILERYRPVVARIILYGSAVRKALTLESDVDLAVEFGECSVREATRFRKEMQGLADSSVDIQVYDVLPEAVREQIDDEGKVVYERKDAGQD